MAATQTLLVITENPICDEDLDHQKPAQKRLFQLALTETQREFLVKSTEPYTVKNFVQRLLLRALVADEPLVITVNNLAGMTESHLRTLKDWLDDFGFSVNACFYVLFATRFHPNGEDTPAQFQPAVSIEYIKSYLENPTEHNGPIVYAEFTHTKYMHEDVLGFDDAGDDTATESMVREIFGLVAC